MNGARTVRYLIVLFLFALTLIVTPTPSARAATASGAAARTPRISASTPAKVAYQGGPVIPLLNNAVTHYRELPGNVTYHNGPVMAGTMNVYAIFWEPAGWVVDPH